MNETYITSLEEGKSNLDTVARALEAKGLEVTYEGEYPGATAMFPKIILNPDGARTIIAPELVQEILDMTESTRLHVYRVLGENAANIAQDTRNGLGFNTLDRSRVHVAKGLVEMDLIRYAKTNSPQATKTYIEETCVLVDGNVVLAPPKTG